MTTPAGVTVLAHCPDGTQVDITEGVMALYDLVISSMNWTSGFLSVEDALPVVEVAKVCGFEECEEAERYVEALRAELAQREEYARLREMRAQLPHVTLDGSMAFEGEDIANFTMAFHGEVTNDHAHAFEKDGVRCVWPGCTLERNHKERDV